MGSLLGSSRTRCEFPTTSKFVSLQHHASSCVCYTQAPERKPACSHIYSRRGLPGFPVHSPRVPPYSPRQVTFPVKIQVCSSMRNSVRSPIGLPVVSVLMLPVLSVTQYLLFRYNSRSLMQILSCVISVPLLFCPLRCKLPSVMPGIID